MTISFSVVTPSFNQALYLPVCIESAQAQSLAPIEHIVIDPGSTDGSLPYLAADARLTLLVGRDTSQSDAVNLGVRSASGDIIAWLNSDDCYVDADVFASVAAVFEADPSIDVVYGRGDYIDERGVVLREFYVNGQPGTLPDRIAGEVGIAQPAAFFRRQLFADVGELDEQLAYSMDYDLWIRAILAGKRFHFLNKRLAKTRVHDATKTFGSRSKSFQEVAENVTKQFGFLPRSWADRWAKSIVTDTDGIIENPQVGELGSGQQLAIENTSQRLLRAFNYGPLRRCALAQAARDPRGLLARQTQAFMSEAADTAAAATALAAQPLLVGGNNPGIAGPIRNRPVNGVSHQFDADQVDYHLARSDDLLERMAQTSPSRAVILGNGPSLLSVTPEDLHGSLVFGSNYVFLKEELWPEIDVLSISNPLVASQRSGVINLIDDAVVAFPWWLCAFLTPHDQTLMLRADGDLTFATDVRERISWCHTVTYFSMQLAYSLGCTEVVLAGFDHYYTQDESLVEGDTIAQDGADTNHFDPSYFGNKRWHAADVDGMEKVYRIAKVAYEADGRAIYNGTDGGHLDVFDRVTLGAEMAQP